MKRLTRRNSHGSVLINNKNIERIECIGNADIIATLASKLAEYEDTGLTPEQINLLMEEHKNK
jgi:hypothetical protein